MARKNKFSFNAGVFDQDYYSALAGYEIYKKNFLSVDALAGIGTSDFKKVDLNIGAAFSFKF